MTGHSGQRSDAVARNRMRQFLCKYQGYFIAKVYRDGTMKWWKPREEM
jgi:hypothetical protein